LSFLKIGDAPRAINSCGTRAAPARCRPRPRPPGHRKFVNWKVVEEQKVADMVTGSRLMNKHLKPCCGRFKHAQRRREVEPVPEPYLKMRASRPRGP